MEIVYQPELLQKEPKKRGNALENMVAKLLEAWGYDCHLRVKKHGCEIDVVGHHRVLPRSCLVECKAEAGPIGNPVFHQFLGVLGVERSAQRQREFDGLLVSLNGFIGSLSERQETFDDLRIILLTGEELIRELIKANLLIDPRMAAQEHGFDQNYRANLLSYSEDSICWAYFDDLENQVSLVSREGDFLEPGHLQQAGHRLELFETYTFRDKTQSKENRSQESYVYDQIAIKQKADKANPIPSSPEVELVVALVRSCQEITFRAELAAREEVNRPEPICLRETILRSSDLPQPLINEALNQIGRFGNEDYCPDSVLAICRSPYGEAFERVVAKGFLHGDDWVAYLPSLNAMVQFQESQEPSDLLELSKILELRSDEAAKAKAILCLCSLAADELIIVTRDQWLNLQRRLLATLEKDREPLALTACLALYQFKRCGFSFSEESVRSDQRVLAIAKKARSHTLREWAARLAPILITRSSADSNVCV